MNIMSILALALALTVFFWSMLTSTDDPTRFVDIHGIVIVFAGTFAAASISFQIDRVLLMIKVFATRTLMGGKPNYIKLIKELMVLADAYRTESPGLKGLVDKSKDPFLKEAMTALMDELVETDHLIKILKRRVNTMYNRYHGDAMKFESMGKYPPAMGLMGAVMGMIALLGGLGKPGAEKTVGPSMSIALVATFYGIAFANLVVIPIGENLAEGAKEMKIKNLIIVEGVKLISKRTNPIVLAEELNSFLLPRERVDAKSK